MNQIESIRRVFARIVAAILVLDALIAAIMAQAGVAAAGWSMAAFAGAVAVAGLILIRFAGAGALTRQATALGLMMQVMSLVYAFDGHAYQADLHMYFFAMLAIVAGWLDARAIILATVAVAAHHLGLNYIYADAVFAGGADLLRVVLHAVIIVLQAAILIVFVQRLRGSFLLAAERSEAASAATAEASEARIALMRSEVDAMQSAGRAHLAAAVETTVGSIAGSLNQSALDLRGSAAAMRATATRTDDSAAAILDSAERATANVQRVADATYELRNAVASLGAEAESTQANADRAAAKADEAVRAVQRMVERAHKIDAVVDLIRSIASQTNLLALNATIEAARAGEAGRGFAVVATEVKALAAQTAAATQDISAEVDSIQRASSAAAATIGEVTNVVADSVGLLGALGTAFREQSESTDEISRVSEGMAQEMRALLALSEGIRRETGDSLGRADTVMTASERLTEGSLRLQDEVARVLQSLRAA